MDDALITRLLKAEQDARLHFTPAPGGGMRAQGRGPSSVREHDAARDAVQARVNELVAAGDRYEARELALAAARGEHERYPQYDGYWDDWPLEQLSRGATTKLGEAGVAGDWVLADPDGISEPRCDCGGCIPTRSFYSLRNGATTAVDPETLSEAP
jgi:hypothetical protein